MYKFQITPAVIFFILMIALLFSMLFVTTNKPIAFSQKVVLSKTHLIQNNSVAVIPFSEQNQKIYEPKYENHSIKSSSFKSPLINNSLSYTITNATITVIKKITMGINSVGFDSSNETIVLPNAKIVNGK